MEASHLLPWPSIGHALQRHPFSGLIDSAGELLPILNNTGFWCDDAGRISSAVISEPPWAFVRVAGAFKHRLTFVRV